MSEENPMCPICGGLHPKGHRDKELEQKLEAIKNLFLPMPEWVEWEESPITVDSAKFRQLRDILQSSGGSQ